MESQPMIEARILAAEVYFTAFCEYRCAVAGCRIVLWEVSCDAEYGVFF